MSKMLDNVRGKVRSGHANFSFLCALVGGVLAALSAIGTPVISMSRIGPWWMPILWWVVLLVICIGDWAGDAIPNRPAVFTALLWPSCAVAVFTGDGKGESGTRLFSAAKAVFGTATGTSWQKSVTDFLTVSSDLRNAYTAFSVVLVGAAVVYAQRYAKSAKSRPGSVGVVPGVPGSRIGARP